MSAAVEHLAISFTRQYPSWLFPGESDIDPKYSGHREPGVEYLIDSLNPFTWRKAVRRVSEYGATSVVIPWWTVFWVPCYGYLVRRLRQSGIEVIFLCHNVMEHETAGWKSFLTLKVLQLGARFLVHTKADELNLKKSLPMADVVVHPHPIYDQFPAPKHTLPRRRGLELLFYGFVRPYKGLDVLVEAMGKLKGGDVQLTIAGEFWEGEEGVRERIRQLDMEDQIEVLPGYHSEDETAELFARADVVVLPYRSATGSGVVSLAYHYDKPVIVTRVGGLPDVVRNEKTGILVNAEDADDLAGAIKAMSRLEAESMSSNIQEYKKSMTWESLVSKLLG